MEHRTRIRKPAQRPSQSESEQAVITGSRTGTRAGGAGRRPARPAASRRTYARTAGEGSERSYYDFTLIFIIICLCGFGLIMLYSVTAYSDQIQHDGNSFVSTFKQLIFVVVGLGIMLGLSLIDYHFWARFAIPAYIVSFILGIVTLFAGEESHGKSRWLKLGPIQFQPAEIAKIALIIAIAVFITNFGKQINRWYMYLLMLAMIGMLALPVLKANLSSGIIIFMIGVIMMFVAAKKKWPFFLAAALGIAAIVIAYRSGFLAHVLEDYQMERIYAWLDPMAYKDDESYQTVQSLYAIASGGFTGKGLGQSIQKLGYLPEAQNDMIFAIICEELGLFGATLVLLLFGMMIWRFMFIATNSPDLLGAMLTVGVMAHISIQVIFNIAVATSVMPNTGIGLPFISSGGSAIMILLAEMAIVLNVSKQIRSQ